MAGFDVVAGVDSWKPAMDVYRTNFPGHDGISFDLSDVDGAVKLIRSYRPFLVAGGPPCQDFSSAGDRKEGDRADLTVKFSHMVAKSKPRAFIMENVPRAALSEAYKTAASVFREAGYGVTRTVLDASRCGVPQTRKRLLMIGMLGEADGFLDTLIDFNLQPGPMTVKEYVGDEFGIEYYYRHPRTYGSRAIYGIDEPSPTIRGVNRPMPGTYRKHHLDRTDPDPKKVRALTPKERALIQTFPASYIWPPEDSPNKGAVEQMIGNAVPVQLAAFAAGRLFEYAEGKAPMKPQFRYIREEAQPLLGDGMRPDNDESFFRIAAE